MQFFKKPEPPPPETTIAPGTRLVGDLRSSKSVTLAGSLDGTLRAPSAFIMESGTLRGEAHCDTLRCDGIGEGTIVCPGVASFGAGSGWSGEFRVAALAVSLGARLEGSFFREKGKGELMKSMKDEG